MLISQFRLITFDFTNTLLKFKIGPGQQYGEIGALYGISCNHKTLANNFKNNFYKMSKEHPMYGRNTGLGWENWWKILVKESFKSCDLNIEDKKLDDVASHLINMYKTSKVWQLTDGANGLLSYIRSKGIPMGVISNYDPRLSSTLTNTKLRHYFQFVLTSYEIGFEKPDPNIFLEAMAKANIRGLQPIECLHIGDQKCLDYDGARKCGWNAILINADKKKYPDISDNCIFNSLFDLHLHFMETSKEPLSSQKF
ncbi:rhythmically expressed gene 2 protein-like [Diorhabda sublineata]|uniref:rhythmically expressed gene 2 protein-like n=1 Tax=Diorhabda sublineata TaxID=1163346 RepID=UPI0024E0F50F|nr:rhythmically expressed gene 2 protein-like [Diorhabda sublineata]